MKMVLGVAIVFWVARADHGACVWILVFVELKALNFSS